MESAFQSVLLLDSFKYKHWLLFLLIVFAE